MSQVSGPRQRAIVIGGGIAGLLAARALVNHFATVTLIERDHYPAEPIFRPGVPQGRQVHMMLLRGQRILERFFPGLEAALNAAGAVPRTYGAEGEGASIYYYQGRCPQVPPILRGWSCSRLLLEWQIRQELRGYSHLQIMEGYEVVKLLGSEQEVRGVQMRLRTSSSSEQCQEMEAALVVDASGAQSQAASWLQTLGCAVPEEQTIDVCINYATRWYRIPAGAPWKEIAIHDSPKTGILLEVEGGRWSVVLSVKGQDQRPPRTEDEFLAFAQSLPEPALYEALKQAEPLSPIWGYRKLENRRRRFRTQPEGFIALGDTLCTFNPIYGQGMTIAAEEALLLDTLLRSKGQKGFARAFQKRAARLLAFPWLMAERVDADSEEESQGGFHYLDQLTALLSRNTQVLLTFLKVMHLLDSPLALASPPMLARVWRHYLKTRRRRPMH